MSMAIPIPNLDDHTFDQLMAEAEALIPKYCPAWTDHNYSDPGITFLELFAFLCENAIYQINRVPERSLEHFAGLVGIMRQPDEPIETVFRRVREALEVRERTITQEEFEQQILAKSWNGQPKIVRAKASFAPVAALTSDEITDVDLLANRLLKDPDPPPDSVSNSLRNSFSSATMDLLREDDRSKATLQTVKSALARELNGVITSSEPTSQMWSVSEKILKLFGQQSSGQARIRLLRLLLEEAYEGAIAKSAGVFPSEPWLKLIILPESVGGVDDSAPTPSPDLRQATFDFLRNRALITTRLRVLSPDYCRVQFQATVVRGALSRLDRETVGRAVTQAVREFIHPTRGGDDGRGWPFGRSIFRSDLYKTIEGVPGVDHVDELLLIADKADPPDLCRTRPELPLPGPDWLIAWDEQTFTVNVVDQSI
jgi:hypothetical protein